MKKVLIAGADSYIGTSFENWLKENHVAIETTTQDMRGDAWKRKNFRGFDAVFHVAGIAHADVGRISEEQKQMYYKVNTELAIDCARKAKADGVKQFIFMSSIIVYGEGAGIGEKKVITRKTPLNPENFYGNSKAMAEKGILKLADDSFKVVILRPPMVYGKGAKGNYPLLARFARKFPVFPDIDNERSMLYIGNLCRFVSLMIENEENGIFFPQNREYVRTSDMVKKIADAYGRNIRLVKIFNPVLRLFGSSGGRLGGIVNKAFGNLVYDKAMSEYKEEYAGYDLTESIRLTEEKA